MKKQNQLIIAILIIGGIFILAKNFGFMGATYEWNQLVWESETNGGIASTEGIPTVSGECTGTEASATIISSGVDIRAIESITMGYELSSSEGADMSISITDGTNDAVLVEEGTGEVTLVMYPPPGKIVYLATGQPVGDSLNQEVPWNIKMTGRCSPELSSFRGSINSLGISTTRICTETDGGQNYELVGQVFINGLLAATDACTATSGYGEVLEYGCYANNSLNVNDYHPCEYGCRTGACLVSESCCIENWHCADWSACLTMPSRPDEPPISVRTRTCTDVNGCGAIVHKPANIQRCSGDCVPYTCADMGYDCGIVSDGCGNTLDCGTCTSGECLNNICKFACSEISCGIIESACGNPLDCGSCEDGYECVNNACSAIRITTKAPSGGGGGGGYRRECYSDDYCNEGQVCVNYVCVTPTPSCKEGEVLNVTNNKCTEVIIQQKSSWWWLIVLIAIIVYYKKRKK